MSQAEQNYAVSDQEMLAIFMSCHHCCSYFEGAWHPVGVLSNHQNLQRFMSTKLLTGQQAHWWETILGDNLNKAFRAGNKNSANTPCSRLDNSRVLESLCVVTVFTARCNTMLRLCPLYAAAIQDNKVFEDVPPNSLCDLNCKGLAEDYAIKEV
jgi:hypothetical protein